MLRVAIIIGSTRPGRAGESVARWVHELARQRQDAEWNNKAAGFVGYGSAGGTRAVENLRLVMGELQVADVRNQVMLSLFTDFENFTTLSPHPRHEQSLHGMLDQLVAWGGALKRLRERQG